MNDTINIYDPGISGLQAPCNKITYSITDPEVPLNFDLKILTHNFHKRKTPEKYKHPNPYFSRIFIFKKGGALLISGKEKTSLKPGSIYLLPAGMPFEIHYEISELIYFHIHLQDNTGNTVFTCFNELQQIIERSLSQMLIKNIADNIASESLVLPVVIRFCQPLMHRIREQVIKTARYKPVFMYINENAAAGIRISDLAEIMGITKEALSKDFSRKMGVSLKSYLESVDQRRAIEYLLYSQLSIQEISYRLGYTDPAYFHKVFVKRTGMTPGKYRKKLLPEKSLS